MGRQYFDYRPDASIIKGAGAIGDGIASAGQQAYNYGHGLMKNRLERDQLGETTRHNGATESLQGQQIANSYSHNQGILANQGKELGETKRWHDMQNANAGLDNELKARGLDIESKYKTGILGVHGRNADASQMNANTNRMKAEADIKGANADPALTNSQILSQARGLPPAWGQHITGLNDSGYGIRTIQSEINAANNAVERGDNGTELINPKGWLGKNEDYYNALDADLKITYPDSTPEERMAYIMHKYYGAK